MIWEGASFERGATSANVSRRDSHGDDRRAASRIVVDCALSGSGEAVRSGRGGAGGGGSRPVSVWGFFVLLIVVDSQSCVSFGCTAK